MITKEPLKEHFPFSWWLSQVLVSDFYCISFWFLKETTSRYTRRFFLMWTALWTWHFFFHALTHFPHPFFQACTAQSASIVRNRDWAGNYYESNQKSKEKHKDLWKAWRNIDHKHLKVIQGSLTLKKQSINKLLLPERLKTRRNAALHFCSTWDEHIMAIF